MDMKAKLSTVWIVVMFNMLFADIFTIMVEFIAKNILDIPGEVKLVMAIAAVVTNIPILMIYFSRILPYKLNRIFNIVAGIFTIIYVISGGSTTPHYIIIASIEVILLLTIIVNAWNWAEKEM
jgi:hypothetical protein